MTPISTPAEDSKIKQKYSVKSLEQKIRNKTDYQNEIGWPEEAKLPIVCLPAGLTDALGGKLFVDLIEGMLSVNIELLILGKGSEEYGKLSTKLAKDYEHRIHIVSAKEEEIRKMYAASDMALFLSDPSSMPELKHCLAYGVVPIALTNDALENYNAIQERGNSFLFEQATVWHAFAAIVRALETYKFPFDWRTIQTHCIGPSKE